jgi:glycosyltransferase involved in cell wall biosynthesis
MPPFVSVIVPLFNKAPYVSRALNSLKSQSFTDFEVIIVDDGSTDGGAEIAESFSDERFRVVRQANAGPGAARNRGIEMARGELTAFLDADDDWLPSYLRRAVDHLAAHQAATASAAYFECPGDRSSQPLWLRRGLRDGEHRATPCTSPERLVYMLAFMHPCTTVARTEIVRRWGGFYTNDKCKYAEDAFLWLKVLLNETVFFDLEPRVRIHVDAGALSKNLTAARPLEPFLERPWEIEAACPPELRGLLGGFLSIRAFKTAAVWGYWGKWREAGQLRRRFRRPGDFRLPYFWSSLAGSSPAGASLGWLARRFV